MTTIAEISAAYPALGLLARSRLAQPAIDPDEAYYFDGPGLVRWMEIRGLVTDERHVHDLGFKTDTERRSLSRWRAGGLAYYRTVEAFLMRRGLTLRDVPTDLWARREDPPQADRGRRHPKELRDEVAQRCLDGQSARSLAREVGVHEKTVRAWRDELKEENE